MKQNFDKSELRENSRAAWILFLGTSLITLYFNPNIQDPFNTPKMILLLLTSALLVGYLFKFYRSNFLFEKSFSFIGLVIIVMFNFFLGISYLFTDLKIVGLIGDTQRRNGLLTYLALSILFLVSIQVANSVFIKRFLSISIITCLALSTYGVIQILGYDIIAWDNPYNVMIGTLGNPNFASALLATLAFMAFVCAFQLNFSPTLRFLSFLAGILSLIAIVQSDSRQGLISFAISFLLFITLFVYIRSKIVGRILLSSTFVLFIFGIIGMLQIGPLQELLYKNSVSVRGYYWRAGLEMFTHNPLTGVGLDSYSWYFKQYRELGYALTYGYNITSSNAHNTIIQLFATGGLFVGVTYLGLILLVSLCGIQNIRNLPKDEKTIPIILFAAWAGFQSQSFVSIDNIGISVWGWVIGGLIVGQSHNFQKIAGVKEISIPKHKKSSHVANDALQPIISTLFFLVAIIISVFLFRAERDTYVARSYATMQNSTGQEIIRDNYKKLVINPLADPYYKFIAAQSLIESGLELEGYSEIKKLSLQDPSNLTYLNWIAYYSEVLKEFEVAINARKSIVRLDPWNLRNLLLLGEIYAIQGDLNNSRQLFSQIIRIGPDTDEAKIARDKLAKF